MSEIDDLLAQLGPKRGNDDADLMDALRMLWGVFWASKERPAGHPDFMREWHELAVHFIRDWDA